MEKYKFPALAEILKVKVGTKYVWEERVRHQSTLVHLLEDAYDIKLNFRAFSFYPNYLYFGMPITLNPNPAASRMLWEKINRVFLGCRWRVYAAYQHVNPRRTVPSQFDNFEDLGVDHTQQLLAELVLMDLNYPSHGVGRQLELFPFQPLIGFSQNPVSRMAVGRPGSLIVRYDTEDELLRMLSQIGKRKSFAQEPFYVRKNSHQHLKSIYKGKLCLNNYLRDKSW